MISEMGLKKTYSTNLISENKIEIQVVPFCNYFISKSNPFQFTSLNEIRIVGLGRIM